MALILIFAVLLLNWPIVVLIHELGHAIPALRYTSEKVVIYICSYGQTKDSVSIRINRLEIWFNYNVFRWRGGLCVSSAIAQTTLKRQIFFFLAARWPIYYPPCFFFFWWLAADQVPSRKKPCVWRFSQVWYVCPACGHGRGQSRSLTVEYSPMMVIASCNC